MKLIHFLLTSILVCIIGGLLATISDFILKSLFSPALSFKYSILQQTGYYSVMLFVFFLILGVFVYFLLINYFYMRKKISFPITILLGVLFMLIVGFLTRKATMPYYNIDFKEQRHVVLFVLIGLLFPLINRYLTTRKQQKAKS